MTDDPIAERPRHTIRVAARRTGLTAATLRAWERRYAAVRPARSDTERRLYSDADIERLRLLRALAAGGHSVAQIARLSTAELTALSADERASARRGAAERGEAEGEGEGEPGVAAGAAARDAAADRGAPYASEPFAGETLDACERAIRGLDGADLHRQLMRALVEHGPARFIELVAAPVCQRVGDLWERGALSVAHEHVASVAIRQALGFLLDTLQRDANGGPRMVATTPPGHRHEFGAMMAAAVAATAGWHVTYLGPDLPVDDVAAAVRQAGATAVALSIVSNHAGPAVGDELRRLRELVGPEVLLVVGGAAARGHASALDAIGAHRVADLRALRVVLERGAAVPPAA